MNGLGVVFFAVNALALLSSSRKWAALPLLIGACYMTLGQVLVLGPFNFPVIRLLILVGLVRVLLRGERWAGPMNAVDKLMLAWAGWALFSALFHADVPRTLTNRLGLVYNACGIYFLLRAFCQSVDDVFNLCKITALLLVPLALEMVLEQASGRNMFALFGGVDEFSEVRDGRVRAQGPFAHSILAGSVGAACLPLMAGLWRRNRPLAAAGGLAGLVMVVASGSSGPIMTTAFAVLGVGMWRWRHRMRQLRWLAVLVYVVLDVAMNAPAYYLLARIDLTGSSTSWHRAVLIELSIRHLNEWWLVGTDRTRHWLDYGVGWSTDHIDITNYYINMGVYGGLLMMGLFIATLAKGFGQAGRVVARGPGEGPGSEVPWMFWTLGAALFAHAATFMSVSYFDQSVVFLYLTLAALGVQPALATAGAATSPGTRGPRRPLPSAKRQPGFSNRISGAAQREQPALEADRRQTGRTR